MKNYWTPEELKKLAELHPSMSNAQLALRFGRSQAAIQMKAHRLGLYKDEERDAIACTRQRRAATLGMWTTMKRADGSTLDCTVEIVNGVRITRAKTVLDPRYTPSGPYVGAITGQLRDAA